LYSKFISILSSIKPPKFMEDYMIEKYTITVRNDNGYSILFEPHDSKGEAFGNKRKIYIISSGKEVLYVGEAKTSIKARLERGCYDFNHSEETGESRNGYRGYKWLDTDSALTLNVAIFHNANMGKEDVEAIEAEIVYLIRKHKDLWPNGQNEIHFNNTESKTVRTHAQSIYDTIIK
jgi:hypothetical protein